jgi:hypothetical protein
MIEFDCEGCGAHVFGYGRETVPKSGMCAVCEWYCEHIPDPEKMIDAMRFTGHLGDRDPFVCPDCGAESWNLNDKAHRYCARCHKFFDGVTPDSH